MKICLIGSSRFMNRYHEVNRKLSLAGHTVYSIAMVSSSERGSDALIPSDKETLDLVHLLKIQGSDECFVITDETGYVGDSTKREIKWAGMNAIEVNVGDHYLNHHLCGKAGIQAGVDRTIDHIKKIAAAGDEGDCRERVSRSMTGVFVGFPGAASDPEAN